METLPIAKKIAKKIVQHGHERVDHYAWLRDNNWKNFIKGDMTFDNTDILDYIKAENAWTDRIMEDSKETVETIYNEILAMEREEDKSFPSKRGDYDYWRHSRKKDNYPTFWRKKRTPDASEEVYFDVNKEAEGKPLYSLRGLDTTDDNRFLGYTYNLTGSMESTLKVRNLETGQDLNWEIPDCTGSWLWIDNENLYFVEKDQYSRGRDIYKINIHRDPSSKKLVFSKPEEYSDMFLSIGATNDKKYYQIYLSSGATQVIYLSKAGTDEFSFFVKGENNTSYSIDHHDNTFYILTNRGGHHNYHIMNCLAEGNHDDSEWKEFVKEPEHHYIEGISIYNDYLVMARKNCKSALREIEVCHLSTRERGVVPVPGSAYGLGFGGARDHESTKVRFSLQTPISEGQLFELDLTRLQTKLLKEKIPPGFDPDLYVVKREYAVARDGEEIPLTIVHRKDIQLNGKNKAFVYSYGSYGSAISPHFSSSAFSLVDRNFVYCVAHIRGGDDKGFRWYLDGKMHKKMNTFNDFIDSCHHLIDQKYTSKGLIAINGGSAGGLLMGAVTNMAPELFGAVVAEVPFVDVINTISDAELPLTPSEWEEWGNPIESKEDFEYMMQYSPYDNVEAKGYPPMLYESGISDENVTYWEPLKMVAKLRELKTDGNELLLRMKMQAGHAGASKKHERIREMAFAYAFILKNV